MPKVKSFDELHESGENTIEHSVDHGTLSHVDNHPGLKKNKPARISLDLSRTMVSRLDAVANEIHVPRQALIKTILDQYLRNREQEDQKKQAR